MSYNYFPSIKPNDVCISIGDGIGNCIYLNQDGYGYKLSYNLENTITFVRQIEQNNEFEILANEEDLTSRQLQEAIDIFENRHNSLLRKTSIKKKINKILENL